MPVCDFINQRGKVPQTCHELGAALEALVAEYAEMNMMKCGSGSGTPSSSTLDGLWGSCDVPAGATAYWWNTTSASGSRWYCHEGDGLCTWTELT